MRNFGIILKALIKNKYRFSDEQSVPKRIGFIAALAVVYAVFLAFAVFLLLQFKSLLSNPDMRLLLFMSLMLIAAVIVLVFGIISLVSTLYLSKDTDFYSTLPVKPSTVFAAKLMFVYLSEAVITAALLLPMIVAYGCICGAWAWFYVISIATLLIIPAIPLMLAAVFAVPVMFIASKVKNGSIIPLVFYIILFGAMFTLYIFSVTSMPEFDAETVTPEKVAEITKMFDTLKNVFFPYTVLAAAALGVPMFGISLGASTAVGVLVFVAISAAFFGLLLLLSRFMYGRSVAANNQTDNSAVKKSDYKTGTVMRALIKREHKAALRTTQVAFQCYGVLILPILFAIVFGISFKNIGTDGVDFSRLLIIALILMICASLGNGAATSFSREGSALSTLKSLPLTGRQIVKAKVAAWLIPVLPVMICTIVIANVIIAFDALVFVLSLVTSIVLIVEYVLFGAIWDLAAPKLKWNDPMQAVKQNWHVTGGQFILIGVGLVLMFALMLTFIYCGSTVAVYTFWSCIGAMCVIFAVVDILLYRNIDKYYNRIEL